MKHPFLIFLLFLCGGFSAVAQPSGNPLVFGENRLTLITPTLFRLEFAHDGKFIDDPTYFAYDRGSLLPASEFRVRELGGNRYEISTSALRIVYEHDGFRSGCITLRPTTSSTARRRSSPTAVFSATTLAARSRRSTALPGRSPCRTAC